MFAFVFFIHNEFLASATTPLLPSPWPSSRLPRWCPEPIGWSPDLSERKRNSTRFQQKKRCPLNTFILKKLLSLSCFFGGGALFPSFPTPSSLTFSSLRKRHLGHLASVEEMQRGVQDDGHLGAPSKRPHLRASNSSGAFCFRLLNTWLWVKPLGTFLGMITLQKESILKAFGMFTGVPGFWPTAT